jgi:hypothetical protein
MAMMQQTHAMKQDDMVKRQQERAAAQQFKMTQTPMVPP